MSMKLWVPALVAVSLLGVALVCGRHLIQCHHPVTAESCDGSECCPSDKSSCCPLACSADESEQTPVQGSDPDKQIVFQVEGLRCPAVKGIGCGHRLRPVLASLDKIEGVEASSTNFTGTLIRVSVTRATDRPRVAEAIRKALADNEPVALAGDELKLVLAKEQWRQKGRVGELSAIEFRALGQHWVKTFARAEQLSQETTAKLSKLVEDQWSHIAQEGTKEKAARPEYWENLCRRSIPDLLARAKELLSDEQLERFKKALRAPGPDEDRPEVTPAP